MGCTNSKAAETTDANVAAKQPTKNEGAHDAKDVGKRTPIVAAPTDEPQQNDTERPSDEAKAVDDASQDDKGQDQENGADEAQEATNDHVEETNEDDASEQNENRRDSNELPEEEQEKNESQGPRNRRGSVVAVTDNAETNESDKPSDNEEAAAEQIVTAGYLKKKGDRGAMLFWKSRYFVLDHGLMMYYRSVEDYDRHEEPLKGNRVQLSDFKLIANVPGDKSGKCFSLEPLNKNGKSRTWEFQAHNASVKQNWIEAFRAEGAKLAEDANKEDTTQVAESVNEEAQ